jgi:hypothetical protein
MTALISGITPLPLARIGSNMLLCRTWCEGCPGGPQSTRRCRQAHPHSRHVHTLRSRTALAPRRSVAPECCGLRVDRRRVVRGAPAAPVSRQVRAALRIARELDHVPIGVAHEHRDVSAPAAERNARGLQRGFDLTHARPRATERRSPLKYPAAVRESRKKCSTKSPATRPPTARITAARSLCTR